MTRLTRRSPRLILAAAATAALAMTVASCSSSADTGATTAAGGATSASTEPLKISASSVPHVEILQEVQKLGLLGDGTLDIKEVTGDIDPNALLESGDVDANYFQHVPYEKDWSKQHNVSNLVNVASVHVEPLGLYSKKANTLEAIPNGSTIAVPNNVTNFARSLFLLQDAGLITLDVTPDSSTDYSQIGEKNITANPKSLTFTQVDAPQLPRTLDDGAVEAAVINGNYALEAGLKPATDSLKLETVKGNPYANVLTTVTEKQNDPRIQTLAKALQSQQVADWITATYQGSVVPVLGS